MFLDESLEETMLNILWDSNASFTASELSQVLKKRGMSSSPELILKLLKILEESHVLTVTEGQGWGKRYRPSLTKKAFYSHSSEHLLLKCLETAGAQKERFVKIDIVSQLHQLLFHRKGST